MPRIKEKQISSIKTIVLVAVLALGGCAPEVGSKAWCEAMNDKPKGDWTANEATDFAKQCLFGGGE
jgi:hypothetical protein